MRAATDADTCTCDLHYTAYAIRATASDNYGMLVYNTADVVYNKYHRKADLTVVSNNKPN